MRIRYFLPFVLFTLLFSVPAFAESSAKARELARQAASENQTESVAAINQLRAMRWEGLDALFETYAADIRRFRETGEATDEWKRVAFALDGVAMQKDAYASQLFWFTDLEQAKLAAKARNKPILSLRLLGNLNEEFSCANSRFFRAVLYSNAEISRFLRENYILHWKSVRPAPKVTIDFGDGRKIERTLTGNSIHYLLDDSGTIIDALPGLYSPQGFLKYLVQAEKVNKIINGASARDKEMAMVRFRSRMFNEIRTKRDKIIAMTKVRLVEPTKQGTTALDAMPLAATKMVTEESLLRNIYDNFSRYEPQMNLDDWNKLARLYAGGTKIDAESLAFIRRQNARSGLSEAEFASLVEKLEKYIALDTARNDFLFHPKLYAWLNAGAVTDVENFNTRVYAEIFKTPDSDKWLGMYAPDVYTALDGGGIIK
ncbi:MAG: hypothetical protein M3384_21675 [Acidobacteriota bacterium]|nr:hypothetical protein [Acidobacteriota bacterium]